MIVTKITSVSNGYIVENGGQQYVFQTVEQLAKEFALSFSTISVGETVTIKTYRDGEENKD